MSLCMCVFMHSSVYVGVYHYQVEMDVNVLIYGYLRSRVNEYVYFHVCVFLPMCKCISVRIGTSMCKSKGVFLCTCMHVHM